MIASQSVGRIPAVVRLLSSLLVVAPLVAMAQPVQPEVSTSSREEIHFSLDLPAPQWRAGRSPDPARPAWDAVLPGFRSGGLPGGVRVPRRGGWLVVPPGTVPRLEVVREDWQPLAPRSLAREYVPVMQEDAESGRYHETPLWPEPGEPVPTEGVPRSIQLDMQRADPGLQPGPAVRLGETAWWRGRRIVNYVILPVRTDGADQAVAHLAGGEWRVRFVADATAGEDAPRSAAARRVGRNDHRFAGAFLNGDQLRSLPTEAAAGVVRAEKARVDRPASKGTPLGHPEVRIPVRRTQLHRVRVSELREDGLLPADVIYEHQIRLYQRRYVPELDDPTDPAAHPYVEVEVPIRMVGEGAGDPFADDDLFLFWGLRPRDDVAFGYLEEDAYWELDNAGDLLEISNQDNVYWLQLADPPAGESWARMAEATLPPAAGAGLASYRRTDRWNEAVAYRENVPAITVERYYYNTILDPEVRVNLSFWAPVPDQSAALIRVGMANQGSSNRTVAYDLVQDQTVLAELPPFTVNSPYERIYEAALPADVMLAEDVALRARNGITTLPLFCYLNWVEVQYDARYEAPFGRLAFSGGDAEAVNDIQIPGFGGTEVGLVEVTDPRNPVWVALSRSNVVEAGDRYTLSLQVDQTGGQRQFYAATNMESNGVPDILYGSAELASGVRPTELSESSADVLVVCHPELREAADQWLDYRRERDPERTFHVVAPQDVFDWYSGGLKNPWAIKRLVNHALANPAWGTWALVLIGDANENPRELGVPSAGRQWSRDWVPTHFHVQFIGGLSPEVLASDEWFANPDVDGTQDFPGDVTEPADLYVGRLPANSPEDVLRILAKIQQVENAQPGETWRRRGIFMADDAWSSGTLDAGGFTLEYQDNEDDFELSERRMALAWEANAGLVPLAADTVWLRPFMEPIYPQDGGSIPLNDAREWCEESGAPDHLIARLSQGATLAHFQGHANHWLMAHEVWFQHDTRSITYRQDVDLLTNVGKPWLFCGMGCHLGDFIQNVGHASGNLVMPGLGENLLLLTDAGAVASYASSGYEFLQNNLRLSEIFLDRMVLEPPSMTVDGEMVASRWMLGEVAWAAEADLLASFSTLTNRQMVYQYTILGDPLLMLDAGPPEVDAELAGPGGGAVSGEVALQAVDASNLRQLTIQARDEAGIARLRVRDSAGGDLTSQAVISAVPAYQNGSRQIMDYGLSVPVRPFPHQVLVEVFDTADRGDAGDHWVLTLDVAHETTVTTADGEPLDPDAFTFPAGEPVDLRLLIASAAWLDEETTVGVSGDALEVSGVTSTVLGNDRLQIDLTVTAGPGKVDRGVTVTVDGYETFVLLSAGDPVVVTGGISGLINVPNPMREETRFVFATNLASGQGKLRIWTVSGRSVADVPFALSGAGQEVVAWDGRDRQGDRLANGTYLYRVEVAGTGGEVRSGMQRLVIMR